MLKYLRDTFSSNTGTSFGRFSTAFTIVVSCFCLVWVVIRNHALPDGAQLVGLGTFALSPYAISKTASVFLPGAPRDDKPCDTPAEKLSLQASGVPQAQSRDFWIGAAFATAVLLMAVLVARR